MRRHFSLMLACLMFSACASQERNQWEDLDYKSVYNRAKNRENDPFYQQPVSDSGCFDEDLYNCSR